MVEKEEKKDVTEQEPVEDNKGEEGGAGPSKSSIKRAKAKAKKERELAELEARLAQQEENKESGQNGVQQKAAENEDSGDEAPSKAKGKNKKKNKKGKKKEEVDLMQHGRAQDNKILRWVGDWQPTYAADCAFEEWKQTSPPSLTIQEQFKPQGIYNKGQEMEYGEDFNKFRMKDEEKRAMEHLTFDDLNALRRAAECHRQVRKHAQQIIRPGKKIMDICNEIEATNRRLIEANKIEAGIAFPTGASINDCAAHWTPNLGDETVLKYEDVMKIDFGSHVRGIMTDCAFTVAFDPVYDNLLEAAKEATETGIRAAGIGARLGEIGAAIEETMTSYEITIGNKVYPVKCCENLCGHSIGRYNIHAGKSVPIVARDDDTKMEEGEQFAIETFGTTGAGYVQNDPTDVSHYMMVHGKKKPQIRNLMANKLYDVIMENFGTLAFCRKWLEDLFPKHFGPLKVLCDQGLCKAYPPLTDPVKTCYTAQFEHTILLRPTCKEVITRGDDF